MGYLEIIKLCTDTGLILSLVFLLYRFLRPDELVRGVRSPELEAQISKLLAEAENAGKVLNRTLEKRQRSLEETLSEIETVESRIKKNINQAKTVMADLPVTPKAAGRDAQPVVEENDSPISFSNVNIFGEVIGSEPKEVDSQNDIAPEIVPEVIAPSKLEIEVSKSQEADSSTDDIQHLYDKAEALLRAGKDIESVSYQTRLSGSEVRMLSEIITRESKVKDDVNSRPPAPLEGMRRLVQTV